MSRWWVALGGTALMACLGTVYAWSVFTQPLQAAFGWSASQATLPFSVAIFFLGVGAVAGGRWQDRAGPRPVALAGALSWAAANLLAGLGTSRLGLPWLVATYGVVGGLGLGLGYVTPVAAVTKWFAGRRGLGSGLVVTGFGLGAFLYAHLLRSLPGFAAAAGEAAALLAARVPDAGAAGLLAPAATETVLRTFTLSGLAFALLGGLAGALVRDPPRPSAAPAQGAGAARAGTGSAADHLPAEMLATPQFWALWSMLFVNVTAGILFISSAVPIMRELTGAAPAAAAAAYGTIALANAAGRFFWGTLSDRLGRRAAFALVYLVQVAAFLAAGRAHSLPLVAALFAVVLLCYGGGFGVMPSFVADWFGTRHLGANYGLVLLAWSAAGLAGPGFASWTKDQTGSYAGALPWTAGLLAAATLLPLLARPPRRRDAAGP
jgi:MFS family permease